MGKCSLCCIAVLSLLYWTTSVSHFNLILFYFFQDTAEMLEDLGIDGIQLWSYIFALTLLDEDDDDLLDFLDD